MQRASPAQTSARLARLHNPRGHGNHGATEKENNNPRRNAGTGRQSSAPWDDEIVDKPQRVCYSLIELDADDGRHQKLSE